MSSGTKASPKSDFTPCATPLHSMSRNQPATPKGTYQPPALTKPVLKRQNADVDMSDSQSNGSIPSGMAEHALAKRFKPNPSPTIASPYKAPAPPQATQPQASDNEPHCLKSSCGNPTFKKVCKKVGPNLNRAFIACTCPEEGGFIWEDTWLDKCKGNVKTVLRCRYGKEEKAADNTSSELADQILALTDATGDAFASTDMKLVELEERMEIVEARLAKIEGLRV